MIQENQVFPVSNWDRYEFIKLLGEGGMGRVYLAWDLRLERLAALKFLSEDNAEVNQRFLQEAQAQAKLDHEYICRVYEVGEVEGHKYIAMQYIAGKSLLAAMEQMTLEQKVKVMKQVAEAINSAHRSGVIHRDIKPDNILVEQSEEGVLRPCVMDFGLAKEMDIKGGTVAGVIMGTPYYMSPEQARGNTNLLDRRSDVFSLGSTYYELLTGRLPFDGFSAVEILFSVVKDDPEPIRKLNSSIPAELETVVMKCLEKNPERRYATAKLLAEDLGHYLDGEPIQAQPTSWTYRARKKIRKNKTLAGVVAVSAILALTLAGWALLTEWRAKEREALAHRLGQEVKEIEWIRRVAYMAPLHDTRQDKALILKRMESIDAEMRKVGRAGEGPGQYALGQGYMALNEYEKAQLHLDEALKKGYRAPEVIYALGLVMGELFKSKLREAQQIEERDLREQKIKDIEKTYRDPAIRFLREGSKVAIESQAYVEGLIEFYEGHYEEALKKAQQAFDSAPWFYEAKRLEGDAYLVIGSDKQKKGDYEGASQDYDQAGKAYQIAMQTARSDSTVYERECWRSIQVMELESARGKSPQESFDHALSTCDRALQADPESGGAYHEKSVAYLFWGDYQFNHGEEPLALDQAIEMARQAIERNPRSSSSYDAIGSSYYMKGQYEKGHGLDPRKSLERAIESFKKAIEITPNYVGTYNNLGIVYWRNGLYEMGLGFEPLESLEHAIDSYKKAIGIDPNFFPVYSNLGNAYEIKGESELGRGKDPRLSLELAIDSYKKAIEINPNYAFAYINIGISYRTKGRYELMQNIDPRPSLDQAVKGFQKGIELNPDFAFAYIKMSEAFLRSAEFDIQQAIPPTDPLNQARVAIQKAIQINPSDYEAYLRQSQIELMAAKWAIHLGQSPSSFFENSGAAIRKALELNTKNAETYLAVAEFYYQQAQWRIKQPRQAQEEIKQGIEMAEKALLINPQMAEAAAVEGALYLLQARSELSSGKRLEAADHARTLLEKALKINPLLQHEYEHLLNEVMKMTVRSNN